MKEKDLDKNTIDTYQSWVQQGIRDDLNAVWLGPGKLPFRTAIFLIIWAFCCLLVGILLVALRMYHVYLWAWDSQFLGPFFVIMFLICMAGASYLIIIAKRRSNKYRSQLYFKPIGDWGVQCVHESELAREEEMRHDLKSGTTPHKTVKPRSEAYSQSSKDARRGRPPGYRGDGQDNRGYDKTPSDPNKPFRPEDRRRGPPPDGRRGPPPDGRRGPPPDGRRGPPPDGRRGPPPDGRRGPPPDGRRGPPPGDRRRPPDDRDRPRGPPPDYYEDRRRGPDDRRPPPADHLRPPADRPRGPPPDRNGPNGTRGPGGAARIPPDEEGGRRPRGVPRFEGVERIPDQDRQNVQLIMDKSRDESDI